MDAFNKARKNNKDFAWLILETIKVDAPSIDKILEK